jgi:hypothetical protein
VPKGVAKQVDLWSGGVRDGGHVLKLALKSVGLGVPALTPSPSVHRIYCEVPLQCCKNERPPSMVCSRAMPKINGDPFPLR